MSIQHILGVIINQNLNWKSHIHKVANTISKPIGILYKLKSFISRDTLLSIYNSLILPHLFYCSIIWGNACPTLVNKIHVLQKRASRFICNASYMQHSAPLFCDLKILNIFNIFRYQLGIHMYKSIHDLLPSHLSSSFIPVNAVHSHNTRNSSKLFQHHSYSSKVHKTIQLGGPKLWNSLDPYIVNSNSLSVFKNRLKASLLKSQSAV